MDITKFQNIINYHKNNRDTAEQQVKDFYFQIGIAYEKELLNVMQVARPLFQKENYIVAELPFRDMEIGAICMNCDTFGYVLINSSLPKINVNFALGHELYHIFYQEKKSRRKAELYMDEHYHEQEWEMAANLFAESLLMPEQSFRRMYHKFSQEMEVGDTHKSTIAKLMNYFQVPYMAALIRCCELQLLEGGKQLEALLAVDKEQIRQEFLRLWLNDEILAPTKRDDYPRLHTLVESVGNSFIAEELLNQRTLQKILGNMDALYERIRG